MLVEERVFDVRGARAPATRYDRRLEPGLCRADAGRAVEIFGALRAADASLAGWVNFPLVNESGRAGDVGLKPFSTPPRKTAFASQLPAVARILDEFAREGLKILFARVAVLGPRDALRPHVDTYPNTRLLIALSEQGDDFRHLYDNACFAMRVGEVWGGDGATCHGAANVAFSGHRVLLLLDVVPDAGAPDWLHTRWRLPPRSAIARPKCAGACSTVQGRWPCSTGRSAPNASFFCCRSNMRCGRISSIASWRCSAAGWLRTAPRISAPIGASASVHFSCTVCPSRLRCPEQRGGRCVLD